MEKLYNMSADPPGEANAPSVLVKQGAQSPKNG